MPKKKRKFPKKRIWLCEHGRIQQGPHTPHCHPRDPMTPVLLTENELSAMEIGIGLDRTFCVVG